LDDGHVGEEHEGDVESKHDHEVTTEKRWLLELRNYQTRKDYSKQLILETKFGRIKLENNMHREMINVKFKFV
jgi:hypothetical protein